MRYSFLKSLMKCDVLGKVHSTPISEMDFEVEMSSSRECISRWRMYHLWGGISKWRRNSFLNEVSERLVSRASSSMEISLKMWS